MLIDYFVSVQPDDGLNSKGQIRCFVRPNLLDAAKTERWLDHCDKGDKMYRNYIDEGIDFTLNLLSERIVENKTKEDLRAEVDNG